MNDAREKLDEIVASGGHPVLRPPYIFLMVAIATCCAIALGWALHYRRYAGDADEMAFANRTLSGRAVALESELETLREKTTEVVAQLTQANQCLAENNETLVKELAGVSKSLETVATQNKDLIEEIARLNRESGVAGAEATKNITELTTVIVGLTDDLNKANLRLEELGAKLQTKTDEAAELAIRVNTLVEMVARLRVLTGLAAADIEETRRRTASDPNSPSMTGANIDGPSIIRPR